MSEQHASKDVKPVRPRRSDVVPGVMRCARCEFRLQRVNLYVNVGAVGAGDNETEPCPNGCGPLWPVTWEQEAREGYRLAEDLFERAKRAEDSLRELKLVTDDLAALVARLAHALRKAAPGNDFPEKAMDYLRRKGLLGSPMRQVRPELLADTLEEDENA